MFSPPEKEERKDEEDGVRLLLLLFADCRWYTFDNCIAYYSWTLTSDSSEELPKSLCRVYGMRKREYMLSTKTANMGVEPVVSCSPICTAD
jgi:hypothetical protein